ncbi:MAG: hypothetical protein ACOC5T_05275 [Elusimicrobiota bacterium]
MGSVTIGKENIVPAFGFAFYQTKKYRNINQKRMSIDIDNTLSIGASGASGSAGIQGQHNFTSALLEKSSFSSASSSSNSPSPQRYTSRSKLFGDKEIKEVSVGAGAQIYQELEPDTLDIDDWEQKESGIIRLYFVLENQFRQMIKKGGVNDIMGKKEGYLDGLLVE